MIYIQLFTFLLAASSALAKPRGRHESSHEGQHTEMSESRTTSFVPTPTFFLTESCYPTATSYFNTTSLWYEQSCTFVEHTKTITTSIYESACKTYTTSAVPTCDDHGVDGRC